MLQILINSDLESNKIIEKDQNNLKTSNIDFYDIFNEYIDNLYFNNKSLYQDKLLQDKLPQDISQSCDIARYKQIDQIIKHHNFKSYIAQSSKNKECHFIFAMILKINTIFSIDQILLALNNIDNINDITYKSGNKELNLIEYIFEQKIGGKDTKIKDIIPEIIAIGCIFDINKSFEKLGVEIIKNIFDDRSYQGNIIHSLILSQILKNKDINLFCGLIKIIDQISQNNDSADLKIISNKFYEISKFIIKEMLFKQDFELISKAKSSDNNNNNIAEFLLDYNLNHCQQINAIGNKIWSFLQAKDNFNHLPVSTFLDSNFLFKIIKARNCLLFESAIDIIKKNNKISDIFLLNDNDGNNLLLFSSILGYDRAIKFFINNLTNDDKNHSNIINYRDSKGYNALDWAVIQGLINSAKILIEGGIKPDMKNIELAAEYNHETLFKMLIDNDFKNNWQSNYYLMNISYFDEYEKLFTDIIKSENIELLKILVKSGLNPNFNNKEQKEYYQKFIEKIDNNISKELTNMISDNNYAIKGRFLLEFANINKSLRGNNIFNKFMSLDNVCISESLFYLTKLNKNTTILLPNNKINDPHLKNQPHLDGKERSNCNIF